MRRKRFWKKIFSGGGWALFTMFVWELVEEGLENLIAQAISGTLALFITKALSTFGIILATQGIKVIIKRALMPIVKSLTYKEGNDKMKFFKNVWAFIVANKFSLIGTASAAVMALSGTECISVESLPAMTIAGFNITPILYYVVLGALSILGVSKKGWETISQYIDRTKVEKEQKAEKKIIKEAKAEIKKEQKAEKLAQEKQSKDELKAQTDAEKADEKAKFEAEHKAKLEEAKAKLLAENVVKQVETQNA